MITRFLGAALAAFLLLCATEAAHADVLLTRDGLWWPKSIREDMKDLDDPTDEILNKSRRSDLELSYDKVSLAGQSFSAAEVAKMYATDAELNPSFRNAGVQAQSRYWAEAADSFAQAAEELRGASQEVALYWRVAMLAETNDPTKTFDAAQQLLDGFPKSYYFAKIQELRARILLNRGDSKGARAALNEVVSAPGMNPRDYFEAKLGLIYLFKFKQAGSSAAKYAAAREEYDRVAREIEARGAAASARTQRLKAKVGIGKCFVYEKAYDKATPYFEQVIADKASLEDKGLLAQAYTGRGDVRYAAIKAELAGGSVQQDQLPRVLDALTAAALDYVRVSKFYVENAGDEIYPATVGAARVWATQFTLTGEKDCELAKRAATYFFAAHKLLPRGEVKRLLTSEVKRFLEKRDEACKVPPEGAPPPGDDEENK